MSCRRVSSHVAFKIVAASVPAKVIATPNSATNISRRNADLGVAENREETPPTGHRINSSMGEHTKNQKLHVHPTQNLQQWFYGVYV